MTRNALWLSSPVVLSTQPQPYAFRSLSRARDIDRELAVLRCAHTYGSSRNTILGPVTTSLPIAKRRRSPPEMPRFNGSPTYVGVCATRRSTSISLASKGCIGSTRLDSTRCRAHTRESATFSRFKSASTAVTRSDRCCSFMADSGTRSASVYINVSRTVRLLSSESSCMMYACVCVCVCGVLRQDRSHSSEHRVPLVLSAWTSQAASLVPCREPIR